MYGNPGYDWNNYWNHNSNAHVSMPQSFQFPNQLSMNPTNQQFFPHFYPHHANVKQEATSMLNNHTTANINNLPKPGSYNFMNNFNNSFPSPPLVRQYSAPSVLAKPEAAGLANPNASVDSGCFKVQPKIAPNAPNNSNDNSNRKVPQNTAGQNPSGFELPASRPPASNTQQPAPASSSPVFVPGQPLGRQLFKPDLEVQFLDNSATEKFANSANFKKPPHAPPVSMIATNLPVLTPSFTLQKKELNAPWGSQEHLSWSSNKTLGEVSFGGNGALAKNSRHILSSVSNITMSHAGVSPDHVMSFAHPTAPSSVAGTGGVPSLPRPGGFPIHSHIFPLIQQSSVNNPLGIPAKPMLPLNSATPQTIQTCFDGYSGDNKENIPPPGPLNLTASSTNDLATADMIEDLVTSLETEAIGSSTTNSLMPKGDHMISAKTKKTRTTFTKAQKEALFWHFSQKRYLGLVDRASLANDLNLSEKQIKIWFQNQRSKLRKEYADVGDNLSADDNLMMQGLQMPPKEFCSKNAHTAPATYACPQSVGMEVGSLGDEGRDREHEEDAKDIYSSINQQSQASSDGCHKTQQQMLDEIAEDEEERQLMNATATALTHKHLPYQQHVEKVAADSTFENNPLVMDCPSV